MAITAGHTLVGNERVYDGFFGRLNGGVEYRIQPIIWNGLD